MFLRRIEQKPSLLTQSDEMEEPFFMEVKDEIKEEELWEDCPQKVQAQGIIGDYEDEEIEEKPNVDTKYKDSNGCNLAYEDLPAPMGSLPKQMTSNTTPFSQMPSEEERSLEYRCAECGMTFARPVDFLEHNRRMKGRPHFFCEPCNLLISRSRELEHQKGYHRFPAKRLPGSMKRPFRGGAEGPVKEGNRPSGKDLSFSFPWEKASGAQDVFPQIDAEKEGARTLNAVDILREIDPTGESIVKEEVSEDKPSSEEPSAAVPFVFKCPCGAGFHDFPSLESHMERLHSDLGLRLFFWSQLQKMEGVMQDDPAGYNCEECGQHFRHREVYVSHCLSFRGKHFYCYFCDEAVVGDLWLKHQKSQRHRTTVRGVVCLECGKQGMDTSGYREHREGLKEKPHAFCEPCGKVLEQEEWESHQEAKMHKGVKLHFYCCDLILSPEEWKEHQGMDCHRDYIFIDKVPLVWKCHVKECGAAFPTTTDLLRHMALHPGFLPFSCRHCHKQFWNRTVRYDHEQREH